MLLFLGDSNFGREHATSLHNSITAGLYKKKPFLVLRRIRQGLTYRYLYFMQLGREALAKSRMWTRNVGYEDDDVIGEKVYPVSLL